MVFRRLLIEELAQMTESQLLEEVLLVVFVALDCASGGHSPLIADPKK